MRTVRDFKNFMKNETGTLNHVFCNLSEDHRTFWRKLNDIGWKKKTRKPDECDDVDATAPLTDGDWDTLETEFRALRRF